MTVRAKNLDGVALVKQPADTGDVLVVNKHGEELKVKISEITEIQRISQYREVSNNRTTKQSKDIKAEELGVFLIYAPLIPVAIIAYPFASMFGLTSEEEDIKKAGFAYEDMTKGKLLKYIGIPDEKYFCKSKYGTDGEVWIYNKDQVIPGGRVLYIDSYNSELEMVVGRTSTRPAMIRKNPNCRKIDGE